MTEADDSVLGAPLEIEITPQMIEAGVYEMRYCLQRADMAYLVRSIYRAMELERLESDGQLASLGKHCVKVIDG